MLWFESCVTLSVLGDAIGTASDLTKALEPICDSSGVGFCQLLGFSYSNSMFIKAGSHETVFDIDQVSVGNIEIENSNLEVFLPGAAPA